jgi:hypothetical protein
MSFQSTSADNLMNIYLALGQYPILSGRIRARMRRELFERGIIHPQAFESQVREEAIQSQKTEGLRDPLISESSEMWEMRLSRMRERLTDLLFSQHLSFEVFKLLVNEVLSERGVDMQDMVGSMNLELAPVDLVFEHGMMLEALPPEERAPFEARLQEAKVVLIRNMISDQLRYINIAREHFTMSDLAEIRLRKIGAGRIGGKAAGMLVAYRILQNMATPNLINCLDVPDSYFIGSDEMYTFLSINHLVHWNDQKYKTEDQMRAEYPNIVEDFEKGSFAPDIEEHLRTLLVQVGKRPLIVRSSSLLEDNFGTSFAGKYDSIFLPNQGNLQENFRNLTLAVARIYASTLNPNALLYRRSKGLLDYDERMAILIQVVQGERFGRYYLPQIAGVAFSRNLYRWAPQIRKEDGFVRLVWGMGTRAVDRVGNDYPRLIALSHPLLRPSTDPKAIRRYSQQFVDLIDLEDNTFKTLPIHEVLNSQYPPLRYIAQLEDEGYFTSLRSNVVDGDNQRLVLTFEELLRRSKFAERMRDTLQVLERGYHSPVDLEFTAQLSQLQTGQPQVCLTLLQCRPQARLMEMANVSMPISLPPEDVVFSTSFMVPQGEVNHIDYVLFVPHKEYFALATNNDRVKLAHTIGALNKALEKNTFICVGPGRWGSSNADLGVPIAYGDIYHARALVELAGPGIGPAPEPSLGTHFYQDLLESQIYPLAIYLEDEKVVFNHKFFYDLPDHTREFIQPEERLAGCLRLIKVSDFRRDAHIRLVMSDERNLAIAFIETNK